MAWYLAVQTTPRYNVYVVPIPLRSRVAADRLFDDLSGGYGVKEGFPVRGSTLRAAQSKALKTVNALAKRYDEPKKKLLRQLRKKRGR